MVIRKIIMIDEDKCNGCGVCVKACHEGAIGMIGGKAKLLRDDYCDGLGDCLPICSTGAISFEEREAMAYDETEVRKKTMQEELNTIPCGCPSSRATTFVRDGVQKISLEHDTHVVSQLNQWPVQIKLVPNNAPYFDGTNLLVAADCAAYAYANFHYEFMKKKTTLIGCPKLDDEDYSNKLTAIIRDNNIKSVTVARMEVPCCGGIEQAVITALHNSGKMIPWQVVTFSTDGQIVE